MRVLKDNPIIGLGLDPGKHDYVEEANNIKKILKDYIKENGINYLFYETMNHYINRYTTIVNKTDYSLMQKNGNIAFLLELNKNLEILLNSYPAHLHSEESKIIKKCNQILKNNFDDIGQLATVPIEKNPEEGKKYADILKEDITSLANRHLGLKIKYKNKNKENYKENINKNIA